MIGRGGFSSMVDELDEVAWLSKEPGPVKEPDVQTTSDPVPAWYDEEVAFLSASFDDPSATVPEARTAEPGQGEALTPASSETCAVCRDSAARAASGLALDPSAFEVDADSHLVLFLPPAGADPQARTMDFPTEDVLSGVGPPSHDFDDPGRVQTGGRGFLPPPVVGSSPEDCVRMARPAIWVLESFTQDSLGVHDWPPSECEAPCVDARECDPPSEDDVWLASLTMAPIEVGPETASVLTPKWKLLEDARAELAAGEDELRDLPDLDAGDRPNVGAVAAYDAYVAQATTFVTTAVALLRTNADLVEWAVCQVATYSPEFEEDERSVFREAVMTAILPPYGPHPYRRNVYLIDRLLTKDGSFDGAWGAATGAVTDSTRFDGMGGVLYEGTGGPVIPIGHPYWRDAVAIYAQGGGHAMCALTAMAMVLLHELIHMCATDPVLPGRDPPGVAADNDEFSCWAIQNMAASAFGWAIGQRFPCMQEGLTVHCCRMTYNVRYFSPETNGLSVGYPFEPGNCT